MLNKKLLVSDARNFNNKLSINPYYDNSAIDLEKASKEHSQIIEIFKNIEIEVIQVPSPRGSQDGIYTANWGLIHNDKALMSKLPFSRQVEVKYARNLLEKMGYGIGMLPNQEWKFSGQGDALICGDYIFCGQGYRSDPEAQEYAANFFGLELMQLQTIPKISENGETVINSVSGWKDSFYYDIDLALAVIKEPAQNTKGLIAYCSEAFTEESKKKLESLENFEKIIVSEKEAREQFACNLVSTGTDVVMSDKTPELQKELEKRGLKTHTVDVKEIIKGGGYIRCISLSI